ncbi:hypothetical protein Tco_0175077 [Tanacetum coccineum]
MCVRSADSAELVCVTVNALIRVCVSIGLALNTSKSVYIERECLCASVSLHTHLAYIVDLTCAVEMSTAPQMLCAVSSVCVNLLNVGPFRTAHLCLTTDAAEHQGCAIRTPRLRMCVIHVGAYRSAA